MEPFLILVTAISVVAAVILFTLRNQEQSKLQALTERVPALEKAKTDAEEEARKRKETLETRTTELTDAKEKLREAKKKLHDEKEVNRKDEIDRAKAQAERDAQSAVDAARHDAAEAQLEIKRLKGELETLAAKQKSRRPESTEAKPAESKPAEAVAAAPAAPAEPRPPRPLTEPEQNRIGVLEKAAVKHADRVKQLEEDVRRHQRRAEANDRSFKVAKSELDLGRARLTSLERRLNRTLLELDKLRAAAFKAGLTDEMLKASKAAEAESDAKEQAEDKASGAEKAEAAVPAPVASATPAPAAAPEAKA
jgi:hypothetical protein